jgi:hypothetical protein
VIGAGDDGEFRLGADGLAEAGKTGWWRHLILLADDEESWTEDRNLGEAAGDGGSGDGDDGPERFVGSEEGCRGAKGVAGNAHPAGVYLRELTEMGEGGYRVRPLADAVAE